VRADLSDVALADGLCQGKVQFKFDSGFKNGDIAVDLNSFSFEPGDSKF